LGNKYKAKTIGREKSLSLVLLHGGQPIAGLEDKTDTSVWNKGQ